MTAIKIDPADNVCIVTQHTPKNTVLSVVGEKTIIESTSDIPLGHKVAIAEIPKGELVIKYGIPIARSTADIVPGDWVHCHNVEDITEELCTRYIEEYRKRREG